MKRKSSKKERPSYLAIEAGGTRTVALSDQFPAWRKEFGPANLRLISDTDLARHFRIISLEFPRPAAIAIGMAGARTEADRERIRNAASIAWPSVPCIATNDLETALLAAEPPARNASDDMPRVLVLSGTGSCCFGRMPDGRTAKFGGWGHILGDKGSGYEIGLRALKAVVYYFDRDGKWSALGARLLRALLLNEPNDLIGWAQNASKTAIAALAVEVFQAWAKRDKIASDILTGAAESLAQDAACCASRLVKTGAPVQFVFAGSILLKQPRFAGMVARQLKRRWRGAIVSPLKKESVHGALVLAQQTFPLAASTIRSKTPSASAQLSHTDPFEDVSSVASSPTEQRNPLSMHLDKMSLSSAVELMLREDRKITSALLAERSKIVTGVKLIVHSFKQGGRLYYVGAGTSGRLGVLDASECPPTFRTDPEMVQGIIAGGQQALWRAIEGAEDDPQAGRQAIEFRGVTKRDAVVGIAASGRTPFVWGALREAKRRGAATVMLCFNPNLIIPRQDKPSLLIAPKIGPEILTGSTRLKSGTATKLVLNIFTTLAMVRMGKVLGNLMVDVNASNAKLRDRAVRIVRELTGVDQPQAQTALEKCEWKIKPACALLGWK